MGIILSTGCSNTVGQDLEEEIGFFNSEMHTYSAMQKKTIQEYRESKNFSTLIGLNYDRNVKNLGWIGASNERIIRSTIDYLETTGEEVDLVLVNLSGKARFTFDFDGMVMDLLVTKEADFYSKNWPKRIVKDKRFIPFYEYFRRLALNDYSLDQFQEHLYRYIVLYLEVKGIPYLISPTIHTGVYLSKFTNKSLDISFEEFSVENNKERGVNGHWLSDAHKTWAELLIKKLNGLYSL